MSSNPFLTSGKLGGVLCACAYNLIPGAEVGRFQEFIGQTARLNQQASVLWETLHQSNKALGKWSGKTPEVLLQPMHTCMGTGTTSSCACSTYIHHTNTNKKFKFKAKDQISLKLAHVPQSLTFSNMTGPHEIGPFVNHHPVQFALFENLFQNSFLF